MHADKLMEEVVKADSGLRTSRRISYVFIMLDGAEQHGIAAPLLRAALCHLQAYAAVRAAG